MKNAGLHRQKWDITSGKIQNTKLLLYKHKQVEKRLAPMCCPSTFIKNLTLWKYQNLLLTDSNRDLKVCIYLIVRYQVL